MSPEAWVIAGLATWGLMLLVLILGMLRAASEEDDRAERQHALYLSTINKKDTHV